MYLSYTFLWYHTHTVASFAAAIEAWYNVWRDLKLKVIIYTYLLLRIALYIVRTSKAVYPLTPARSPPENSTSLGVSFPCGITSWWWDQGLFTSHTGYSTIPFLPHIAGTNFAPWCDDGCMAYENTAQHLTLHWLYHWAHKFSDCAHLVDVPFV